MKFLFGKILTALFLCFVAITSVHCGSAAGGGTPPIDIPTPVSHLSISSPDPDGDVTVTASATFADGNTAYTITNLTSTGSTASLFISVAWAQSSVTGTTNMDGSFRDVVDASAGDTLEIMYISGGSDTTVTVTVPANQPLISTSFTIEDVVIDPDANEAFIIGNDGVDGAVFALNLTTKFVTNTLTIPGASGVFRAALDATFNHAIVIDSVNDTIRHVHPDTLSIQSTNSILSPVGVAIGASGNYAIVTHNDNTTAVSFFDSTSDTVTATAGASGDDGETLQMCSLVDTGNNGSSDLAAVICLMSDDEFHLFIYTIDPSTPSVTQTQDIELTGITPGGISLFNSASEVLVTNIDSNTVLRVLLSDESITEITVGNGPQGITVNNVDNRAYVVNTTDRNLSIIDLSDNSTSYFADVLGLDPTEISMDRDTGGSTAVVVNQGDGTVNLVSD